MDEVKPDIIQRDRKTTLPQFKLKMQTLLDQEDVLPVLLIGAKNEGTFVMTTGCDALEQIANEALQKVLAHLETHT